LALYKSIIIIIIKQFIHSKTSDQQLSTPSGEKPNIVRVVLPFKDQLSADIVKKQLKDLSLKTHTTVFPVFVSHKIEQELQVQEPKPQIVDQQCVVYSFQCNLCDAGYVGYTRGHLHERVTGHKQQASSIYKHYRAKHDMAPGDIHKHFRVLKKCKNKFDCLIHEMLLIKQLRPSLNIQSDSIRAKLFT